MIRFWIRHPVSTWMLMAALLVCGAYALPRLDLEAMPDTDLPSLSIQTAWNGASPSAIQRSITVPLEEAARRCHGIEKIESRSAPGRSSVTISFRRDTNLDFARLELSEQLGAVRRDLPATATQPVITPIVPEEFQTDDFFSFSLVSPLPTNELRDRAEDWLVPRLLAISGVADAELQGGARPLVKVLLDLDLMERYGLTADAIYGRLSALDDILPAGVVRQQGRELTVSVQDSVSLERLRRTVLANVGGQPITLGQIARLQEGFEDPAYFVRIDGENVIQANVRRRSGENAVGVSRHLRAALPELREAMPFPVSFEIDEDQGHELEEKLQELVYRSLVILALLFVLLALALRQVRLTGVVVASILLAIVISLSIFYFLGISVNFITISGLTVCFGMLLDNSILVLDAVHRRLSDYRARRRAAAREGAAAAGPGGAGGLLERILVNGAREVAFPVLATTLTTVVAFLSFIFLSGRLSLYYVPLAVSVGIAMLASIFVAFCWMPVALRGPAAKELRRAARQQQPAQEGGSAAAAPAKPAGGGPVANGRGLLRQWAIIVGLLAVVGWAVLAISQGGHRSLQLWPWAVGIPAALLLVGVFYAFVERITAFHLRFWWYPVVLSLGLFAGTWYVFQNEIQQGGFWRQQSEEQLRVYIERPVGTDVVLSTETMKLFEAELLPLPEGAHMKSWSWENRAFLRIEFEPELLRSAWPELFRNRLILLAEEMGGMFIWIGGFGDPYLKGGMGGGLSNSLLKLTGYNSKMLDEISDGIMARLARNRRVRNVRLSSGDQFEREGADETVIVIHRERLAQEHLSVAEVLGYLRRLLGIEEPWHMIVAGEDRRLQLSFQDAQAIQYDQVMSKVVPTRDGRQVRLADLISLQTRPVVGSILREDQRYAMQINWEYIGTDRMRSSFMQEILAGLQLPYGYTAEDVSGQLMSEEEEEQMKQTLWITLLFIFMTLAALFESATLPLLVLLAVPMALTGVVGIFWATDSAFDSSAKIGLVLLFGIVVNNAILLVNRFRLQLRELAAGRVEPKARLGGMDLWPLPGPERRALLREAICSGVRIQQRSILLTSGTTIAGLIPLLVKLTETTEGKDIWENLALSSIGGLASSTLLILSAMPACYWIFTRTGWSLRRLWERLHRSSRPTPATAITAPAIPPPGGTGP